MSWTTYELDYALKQLEQADRTELQVRLAEWITKDILNTVAPDDILQAVGGVATLRGNPISTEHLTYLKEQAEAHQKSILYDIFKLERLYHANRALKRATRNEELIFPKALLYLSNVDEIILKRIANL